MILALYTRKDISMMVILPLLVSTAIWAYFLLIGLDGYFYIDSQNIHQLPNFVQTSIYVIIPAMMFAVSLCGIVLVYMNKFRLTFLYLSFALIFGIFPYILAASGGV